MMEVQKVTSLETIANNHSSYYLKLKQQKANENTPQKLHLSESQPRIISMNSNSCSLITLNSNNTSSNCLIKSDNIKRRKNDNHHDSNNQVYINDNKGNNDNNNTSSTATSIYNCVNNIPRIEDESD